MCTTGSIWEGFQETINTVTSSAMKPIILSGITIRCSRPRGRCILEEIELTWES